MVRKGITLGNVLVCLIVIILAWVFIVTLVIFTTPVILIPTPEESSDLGKKLLLSDLIIDKNMS